MKKYGKAIVNLAVALTAFGLIIFFLPRILWFFAPFVAGYIISLIASPLVKLFEEKLKIKKKAGSAFVIIVIIALVVTALYFLAASLGKELFSLITSLPDIWMATEEDFTEIGERLSVIYSRLPKELQGNISNFTNQAGNYLSNIVRSIGTPTITVVGNIAKGLPNMLIAVIMALLSAYLFVSDKENISRWFYLHTPKSVQDKIGIIRRSLKKAVGGYLVAQLKIEVWMYVLLVVGLTILRVDYTLLIALGIAFLDLLPFFGTGTIMIPWAVIKILSADYSMAVGLLIIWIVGQLARQIIQPKFVGESVGMPPLPTLLLLYTGYRIGGVLGMIIAVPVGLIVISMYEEGVFETTRQSVKILADGINNFRNLDEKDFDFK